MRILRIHIDGFGGLRDFDTGPSPLERLVVVLGPNEAGKSTLFTFLTTALYGFQPASRERNPHVPWGSQEAAGRIQIRLDGEGCAEIERTLRSQPTGRLTVDGRVTELRNQPIPWVEHVPRTVFRQVFAVTLGDLAGLDAETWARIQDKVVGSMGASDLRSARSVADALEREAGEIWRPNRRGNQRLRDLQSEIRALRTRRATAHERDRKIRALMEEREAVQARLQEAREQRQHDRTAVERTQSLLPVRRQLERIASLRAEGGDRSALRGLPSDPPARLAELEAERAELEVRRQSIERELVEPEATIAQLDDPARQLLERGDEIARLVARAAGTAPDRLRALELEGEIRDLEARLDVAAEDVLAGPWRDASPDALMGIPIELLRDRVASVREPHPTVEASHAQPGRSWWVAIAALVAGLALLAWGLATGLQMAIVFVGTGLSATALTVLLTRARGLVSTARGAAQAEDRLPPRSAEAAQRDVAALLADVPVRADYVERPGDALISGLERLQELLSERGERARARDAARERVTAIDGEARRLARGLGLEGADDAESISRSLDRGIRRAERLQDAVAGAERESRRLRLESASVLAGIDALAPGLSALRDAAAALADGNLARGLEDARARLAAHLRADQLQDELERAHANLDELKAQIEAADHSQDAWTVDDDDLARRRARIEAHGDEIERLVTRAEALERDAIHLRELETVDAVDGETAGLQEQEARLVRERDRKWVLAQLVREADRRFREEHQPDLIRRAGSYMEHLTGGRYDRLVVDETAEGNLFRLMGPGLPAPIALAPPVSTGTLEQAYLSLRLAIVDHLDQGGERLPLFIDEVFVNWDRERRAHGLEVLADLSTARQLFVFTCHPGVAAELERRGGRVLRLELAG